MVLKLLSLLPTLGRAASFLAAFFFGKRGEKIKQLEAENVRLRNEIKRLNATPITDADVDRMLREWEEHIRDK